MDEARLLLVPYIQEKFDLVLAVHVVGCIVGTLAIQVAMQPTFFT